MARGGEGGWCFGVVGGNYGIGLWKTIIDKKKDYGKLLEKNESL